MDETGNLRRGLPVSGRARFRHCRAVSEKEERKGKIVICIELNYYLNRKSNLCQAAFVRNHGKLGVFRKIFNFSNQPVKIPPGFLQILRAVF